MSRRFELVCVDAVDTLCRVRGSVGSIYATLAARYGWQADGSALETAFHRVMASPPALATTSGATLAARERAWWREIVARVMTPFDREPAFDDFFAAAFDYFATAAAWEILPGATDALVTLRNDEGRRLMLVSEMDGRAHALLADLDLATLFEFVALSSQLDARKSDGTLFATTLARARVDASRAVHVGDNLATDIKGAIRAGITPVLIDPSPRTTHPPHIARIHAWRELPALLRQLEASPHTDA